MDPVPELVLADHGLDVPLCRIDGDWGGQRALLIAIRAPDMHSLRFYLGLVTCWRAAAGIQRGGARLDVVVICACAPDDGRLLCTWQADAADVIAWEAGRMTNGSFLNRAWVY